MVFRKISQEFKECALSLWERGWDVNDIADILCVSRASIYRWQANLDNYGTIIRPSIRGAPRIISRIVMTAVHTLFETDHDLYLDEIIYWLAINHNVAISKTALHDNLKHAGLTRKLLHKVAVERNEQLRQQWRDLISGDEVSGEGIEFVCVDETSKDERTFARRYGRAYRGERAELTDVFVRGDRYSLLCAMTVDGYIAAEVVEGSFDSLQFYQFIEEQVVGLTTFTLLR
ncbi:hypothetical protein MD484_g9111, partial [Candolleomyces efflorescens]